MTSLVVWMAQMNSHSSAFTQAASHEPTFTHMNYEGNGWEIRVTVRILSTRAVA